jgi:threonine dehydratase
LGQAVNASVILDAWRRIKGYVRETPLEYSPYLSRLGGAEVYLKLENMQVTGSFKARGVFNKLLSMSPTDRARGVVTASTGNHGAALAYAARLLGVKSIVVLPENVPETKVRDIVAYGASILFHGRESAEAERYARGYAAKHGMTYVSPYNDVDVIAGQGTIGVEIHRQLGRLDAVLVPVGGGGLASGVAAYLKDVLGGVEIIGCQPANSAAMYHSVRAGGIVEVEHKPTLADGVAGGIEPGAITFELCRRLVDRFTLHSEEEIAEAIRYMLDTHHMLVEGAAALPVASYMKLVEELRGKRVVLVITGRRISLEHLRGIICG